MRYLIACLVLSSCASNSSTAVGSLQEPARPAAASRVEEIGSLRNARPAVERRAPLTQLTYFARELSTEQRDELARVAPNVRFVVGLSREEALARAGEAHGVDASYATPEFLRAAPALVWVQAHSAGVDRYMATSELVESERIVLTNFRGVHGPAIADHVFAMLLALTRDLPVHLAARADGTWKRDGSGELTPIALQDRTLLVVGLGGIGSEVARRAHGFGMRVIATRRSTAGAEPFVERVGTPDQLLELLPTADVVVICVPLTTQTEGLFDAAALAAMKRGSYLVNIARGKVVDTAALVEALQKGHLAGACLDVTDPEPLPAEHALWRFPNVVITPHVASSAELTEDRAWALFRENVRRFDAGEPLLNCVDKDAGY